MAKLGEDIIGTSALPAFFKVDNADEVGITAPENRMGDALRTWVRSFSGFQKEAFVRSAKTGDMWRFVSDEGPYLNGYDAACCPLAFLSCGMVASFMNEIMGHCISCELKTVVFNPFSLFWFVGLFEVYNRVLSFMNAY